MLKRLFWRVKPHWAAAKWSMKKNRWCCRYCGRPIWFSTAGAAAHARRRR